MFVDYNDSTRFELCWISAVILLRLRFVYRRLLNDYILWFQGFVAVKTSLFARISHVYQKIGDVTVMMIAEITQTSKIVVSISILDDV